MGRFEKLATGQRARAILIESRPLGLSHLPGADMYAFIFTVLLDGQPPYRVAASTPVPEHAKQVLYPGANLPAQVNPAMQDEVAVDWDAALREATHVPMMSGLRATT